MLKRTIIVTDHDKFCVYIDSIKNARVLLIILTVDNVIDRYEEIYFLLLI